MFLLPLCLGAASETIPLDPAVRVGKLPNGLTYYIRKNAKPEKRAELRLAVRNGSVAEDDDQRGLAHLVEHMCFNGTKNFPKNDIIHYLQSIGVNFGPDINGYTSFDETVYMLTVPSDKEEILTNGFKIMRDWAHDVTFDNGEVDKERGVVVEEWRLGRGAGQRMWDKILPTLFAGSKYAVRKPIGEKEIIEGASYDTIKRFYHDWYRPEYMAFMVVGDVDLDKTEQSIRQLFGDISTSSDARVRETYSVPNHDAPRFAIVSDKENTQNIVLLYFKTEVPGYQTADDFRRMLTEQLFLTMFRDRLRELIQKPNPPFINAGANYGRAITRVKNAYQVYAVVPDGGIEKGFETLVIENERVKQHGFTDAELHRAKLALLKSLEQRYLEREKTQSNVLVGELIDHFLGGEPAPGIEYEYQFAQKNLEGISLAEVNALINRWITSQNRVIAVQGVEKESLKLPTEAALEGILAQASQAKVDRYQEKQLASSLMTEAPKGGKVVAEKAIPEAGVTELQLANGVRVVLKPTDFQNDQILFNAYRPGGGSLFPDDFHLACLFAGQIALDSGVADFSKIDLQKMLAGKKVTVTPSVGMYFETMRGSCAVADLETMLQLTHLYFAKPRRDDGAFQSFATRTHASMKNALSNPPQYFFNEAQKERFKQHPRNPRVLPTEQQWADLTAEKAATVYRSRFGNAGGFTFVFVGSFKVDQLKPLLETYLGGLPSGGQDSKWKDIGLRPIAGPVDKTYNRGSDPKSFVTMAIDGETKYSVQESHVLWSLCNILRRVYDDKLREEMSGVYGFGLNVAMDDLPYGHYEFELILPCAPEATDKLVAAAVAELKRIQTSGVTEEELKKELESQRRTQEKDAKENRAWLWKLEKIYREGENFDRVSNPEALIKLVTPEALQKAAVTYLTPEKIVRFTLYPVKNDAAK